MTVREVLQVNVRLSEGGAAAVARTLSDGLRQRGIASPFAYGYGRRGQSSPLEASYEGVKITPAMIAALNRSSYAWNGHETRLKGTQGWRAFKRAVETSDIVHLHAIHSYIAATGDIFAAIATAGRPVVWTLHDQWAMTGRCAQPGECRRWETGCKKCPDLHAYPPANRDRAAPNWQARREYIRQLQGTVPVKIVACADWLAEEATVAGFGDVSVIKNSVDPEFWKTITATHPPRIRGSSLFMCRDLRDTNKVNWTLLAKIAAIPARTLTIIGNNPSELPLGTTHRSAITSRKDLALVLLQHENLIFTSKVDYFPLTIAEALSAGTHVLALDSRAAREFELHPLVQIFPNELALLSSLRAEESEAMPYDSNTRGFFDPERMVSEYVTAYEELLTT